MVIFCFQILSELGRNATTNEVESITGMVAVTPDGGVVFRGDAQVPFDSAITDETITEVLASHTRSNGLLTDGQSTLNLESPGTTITMSSLSNFLLASCIVLV